MTRRFATALCALILVAVLGLAATRADRLPALAAPWAQTQLNRLKTHFVESSGRAWFVCEDFAATIGYRMHRLRVAVEASRDGNTTQAREFQPKTSLTDADT